VLPDPAELPEVEPRATPKENEAAGKRGTISRGFRGQASTVGTCGAHTQSESCGAHSEQVIKKPLREQRPQKYFTVQRYYFSAISTIQHNFIIYVNLGVKNSFIF